MVDLRVVSPTSDGNPLEAWTLAVLVFSQLCGCCVPYCQDGLGLPGCQVRAGALEMRRNQGPAELGEHVLEGGFDLSVLPGLDVVAGDDPDRALAVPVVPGEARVQVTRANGAVRSTARRVRLRASSAPRTLRASRASRRPAR